MASVLVGWTLNWSPLSLAALAFTCYDGTYLPKQENKFVHLVTDELETYQEKGERNSVLLFPPLPNRLRYLTHKAVEDWPEFTTFSVGEDWHRRVAVCHSELRVEVEEDRELDSNISACEDALRHKEEMENGYKPKHSVPSRNRGSKRPDKPLYMPRAARERLSLQNAQESTAESCPSCSSCVNSLSDSHNDTADATNSSSTSSQGSQPSVEASIISLTAEMSLHCPREEDQDRDQSGSCQSDMTRKNPDTDKKYDPTVPCDAQTEDTALDATDLTEEIKAHLKEAVVFSIDHVHHDYSSYENVCVDHEGFGHVIEIYNFPPLFKTEDLLDAFTEYSEGGMKIKWVDNTHALGVFSSESAALHALSICHPLLKTRALSEGSKKAKGKAIRRAEFIQPVKERPRTDSAVARRMVTRALGLRGRGRAQRY
ncbi:R3H and coiled-coil domain-containing protein 1 [Betta splendens]|uniref:R3H and coiled-coil domain-containing protein 1 n=1 Tax=Betta splendens TaxID=158456 RepID=A0A6P7MHZ3_BETSP|nr:R3H and coiled-coil domain-containing protein 1 [Betta splendens]